MLKSGHGRMYHYRTKEKFMSKNQRCTLAVATLLLVSCKSDITEVCNEGNKAVITVYNNSLCTPDVSVNGDEIASDLGILDEVSVQVDAGSHEVTTTLSLFTLCTALDWEVEVACGDTVLLTFE